MENSTTIIGRIIDLNNLFADSIVNEGRALEIRSWNTRPKIHSFIRWSIDCPIQSRRQMQLGARSFYVERNNEPLVLSTELIR